MSERARERERTKKEPTKNNVNAERDTESTRMKKKSSRTKSTHTNGPTQASIGVASELTSRLPPPPMPSLVLLALHINALRSVCVSIKIIIITTARREKYDFFFTSFFLSRYCFLANVRAETESDWCAR